MREISFPPGFEALNPWADWSHATMDARRDRRINSSMEEIEAFYDAILPHMSAILAHLADQKMETLDTESEALMNLSLTLAEMAPAVELFGEPTISYGYDVTRFTQGPR